MKLTRTKILVALVFAGGVGAFAQTNNNVPRATDYAAFSRFISDRNIFDPNRQPHYTSSRPRTTRPRTRPSPSAPAFTLVGTMGYAKGMFAFFSGNNEDLKKVLPVAEQIAGYTVADIVPGHVTLVSTNQEKLQLVVGDMLRQENGKWALVGPGEVLVEESTSGTAASSPSGSETSAAASASAAEPNDILKKLMEKRAKETQ